MDPGAVLHIEDELADAFLLEYAFRKRGILCPLLACGDGRSAIAYLSGQGSFADRARYPLPCLVLLDLKLPGLSGFEVLEWIRNQPGLKNLAVIVFSSSSFASDSQRARALGANSFISKPANLEGLVQFADTLKGWGLGNGSFAPPSFAPS